MNDDLSGLPRNLLFRVWRGQLTAKQARQSDREFHDPARRGACATIVCMTDPSHPLYETCSTTRWQSAQRLAIDVIEYPADKRDEVMQRMGDPAYRGGTRSRLHT